MNTTEIERGDGLNRSLMAVALAGVALTLLSPFLFGARGMLGVGIGGALALANLWAIAAIVRGFLRGAGLPWGIFGALKFAGLFLVVLVVLKNGWAEVLPLVLGYTALPLGIVFGQLGRGGPSRQKV